MAQITSSVGLISGINTGQIIQELLSLDAQPVTQLQNRIASAQAQTQAYQDIGSQVQSLQTLGQSLELPSNFAAATANSSNQNVLTATASAGAASGSYSFNVASLVTSQQAISNGYASANALVGAGTLTITEGGGQASSETTLADLNGGTGVSRGQFRITDGSGNSSVIDTSNDVTLDDVVNQINSSLNISVKASIQNNHLVLQDQSGQTKANFSVADLGSGTTAAELGIVGSTNTTTITGTNINQISDSTPLTLLNDGRGVSTAAGAPDFQVDLSDGSNVDVSLSSAQTVGDVINAINKAGNGKLTAAIDASTNSIKLTDHSGGSNAFGVAPLNGSSAATDLGLGTANSGNVISGRTLLASLDSVLTSSLNGGQGLPLGSISVTDRTGASKTIDLSGASSVQDIISDLNNSGLAISASLNNAGDGIQLKDTSGASGNIVISDVNSTTAQSLGIAGTFDTSTSVINGANLHTQYVANTTLLSQLNGGKGVDLNSFTITNSKGETATVDLSQGTFTTVGNVLAAINAKNIGVTASINSNGDGILLTDSAGGSTKLKVTDGSGTTAADLNIAGTATGTTIDGSYTKTIAVTSTDTLTTVQQKIQSLGFGVSANIINDGSATDGYHLSITALNSGLGGQFTFDGGTTSIQAQNVVRAQNASLFYGGGNGVQPLLITSSSNSFSSVIPGVTIQATGTGQATINVAPDPSQVSNQLQTFATTFNALITQINTLTQWNSTTNQGGLLLGDATVEDVQQQLYNVYNTVVTGAGQYHLFSDLGLTINNDGTLSFDSNKFATAYANDPTAVQNLFTQAKTGLGAALTSATTELVDPVSGEVTIQENTLQTQITGWQSQITQLNTLLAQQQTQLETEFANMESTLATLQSQGAQLSSINNSISKTSSSSSNTSNIGNSTSSSSSAA